MNALSLIFNKNENVFSKNEVQEFYENIKSSTPNKMKDLEMGGEFDYFEKHKEGFFNRFYSLRNGLGGKTTNFQGKVDIYEFDRLRDVYINQKLAENLNLSVPKVYGFKLYLDKKHNILLPMVEMTDYKKETISKEFKDFIPDEIKNKFDEKKSEILKYLTPFSFHDIRYGNAIWLPDKNDIVLIDTDYWNFKGVKY